MSKVINIVAGPGVGKSVMTSALFVQMKVRGLNVEIVPEYAKQLVWTKQFELLNDQYHVSFNQYKLLAALKGATDYIITDGSLLHGLVYNAINPDNTSNQEKTEAAIMKWFGDFENEVIFLERNPAHGYQQEGRLQDAEEAAHIDNLLRYYLHRHGVNPHRVVSDLDNIEQMINHIVGKP